MIAFRAELRAAGFASVSIVLLVVVGYAALRLVPAWLLDLNVPYAPLLMVVWLLAAAAGLVWAAITVFGLFLRMLSKVHRDDG